MVAQHNAQYRHDQHVYAAILRAVINDGPSITSTHGIRLPCLTKYRQFTKSIDLRRTVAGMHMSPPYAFLIYMTK